MRIILQILLFAVVFLLLFFVARCAMANAFIPLELAQDHFSDFILMFALGSVADLRVISIGFLPLLVCALFAVIFSSSYAQRLINYAGGGQSLKFKKLYLYFSNCYIGLFAFICIFFVFVNFYYYQTYQSHITSFIFALKDDDTSTILGIIFRDYPTIILLFICVIFSIFCVWLNTKFLHLNLPLVRLKFRIVLTLFLVFMMLYILALRGGVKEIYKMDAFSTIESFNAIMQNPILSFVHAHKFYQHNIRQAFEPANESERAILEEKLFPLFVKTPKNDFDKPHIMVNLMESFGGNILAFHSKDFNLLGALEKHFEQDFVWHRFLSYGNDTATSFSFLFLGTSLPLIKSHYSKHYLPHTPIESYKKQGYKVIFLTSGNRSWYNIGEYIRLQSGIEDIVDEVILMKHYPQSAKTRFAYGVLDEYMYEEAFSLLSDAKEPLLIIALSTSNHSPFPKVYESISLETIPSSLSESFQRKMYENINTYAYANNEFGKFLDKVKQSPLKDHLIIAAAGDHRVRDMQTDFIADKALSFSVPFYLYLPESYRKNIVYDSTRVGSHKDIFPTLYAFSLSEVEVLNLGGRNLLGEITDSKYEFGYNTSVSIDKEGIYPNNSKVGYGFLNPTSLQNNKESFEINPQKEEFLRDYKKFLDYQLRYRLINLQE